MSEAVLGPLRAKTSLADFVDGSSVAAVREVLRTQGLARKVRFKRRVEAVAQLRNGLAGLEKVDKTAAGTVEALEKALHELTEHAHATKLVEKITLVGM